VLETLEKICKEAYYKELVNGIPSPGSIKNHLHSFLRRNEREITEGPTLYKLIDRFLANDIKYGGRDKSPNTIRTYHTVLVHLKEFEVKFKTKLDFFSITLDFYYRYVSFLKGKNLSSNAIGKDIQILKVFMSEAVDLGYTDNMEFKHKKFHVSREDSDAVYLTEKELWQLYQIDFRKQKRLEQARDLFILGCYTGLRFSDYSMIKTNQIVQMEGDYFIKLITQKTKELVIIPCNEVILDIFRRYAGTEHKLPKAISNQKFNEYIKEVCKLAGLTEKGRLSTDPDAELWECVSSHTARRSFATNLFMEGYPTIEIMKVTGHRTEKAFMRYIKVSKLDAAMRLSQHLKTKWQATVLKLAS
jgi:integrase